MNEQQIPRPWEFSSSPSIQSINHPLHHPLHHPIQSHLTSPAQQHTPIKSNPMQWLHQAKTVIDQLGGVEGVLNTMSKVHHVVKQVHQMAPLIHGLIGMMRKDQDSLDLGDLLNNNDEEHRLTNRRSKEKKKSIARKPKSTKRKPKGTSQR